MAADEILRAALDEWKAGIDEGDPQRVAEAFTDDAVFQGLRPYSVGRPGVAAYYAAQPAGMSVSYSVLETRRPASELVLGYVAAKFSYPDRPPIDLHLGVLVRDEADGRRIAYYQASTIDA